MFARFLAAIGAFALAALLFRATFAALVARPLALTTFSPFFAPAAVAMALAAAATFARFARRRLRHRSSRCSRRGRFAGKEALDAAPERRR